MTASVACVLPVRGHAYFVDKAIGHFVRQQDQSHVLVFVHPHGRIPGCPATKHLNPSRIFTIADSAPWPELDPDLLFRACQLTMAEAATWWLPLDFMADHRLTRQLTLLDESGAAAVAACDTLIYHLDAQTAREGQGVTHGTLMVRYRCGSVRGTEILTERDPDWYLSVQTGATTTSRSAQVRPIEDVVARLGNGRKAYALWRSGVRTPSRDDTRPFGPRPLNVAVPLLVFDGFGSMGEYLVRSLTRELEINVTALELHREGLHQETTLALDRSNPQSGDPALALVWVGSPLGQFADARPLFINTMWESTELPAGFASRLNRTRAVIVPSRWVAEIFRSSGVVAPIEVVPQGIDPGRYPLIERQAPTLSDQTITTLIVAAVTPRKNVAESIEAWSRAFHNNPHARLLIKSRFGWRPAAIPPDPRITLVDSNETTPGISHWYAKADVVLALGSEGFGLPLVEAMSSGLPVIALDAQGQCDTVAAARGCLLSVPASEWVPYEDGTYAVGLRAVPDIQAVADALTWVAGHRLEAWELGRRASSWAHRNRNIWDMGPRMVTAMRAHLHDGEELPLAVPAEPGPLPRNAVRARRS